MTSKAPSVKFAFPSEMSTQTQNILERSQEILQNALTTVFYTRIGITLLILAWTITLSIMIASRDLTPDDTERYFYLHRLWFGEESSLRILWDLWFYTLVFFSLQPVIREILRYVLA